MSLRIEKGPDFKRALIDLWLATLKKNNFNLYKVEKHYNGTEGFNIHDCINKFQYPEETFFNIGLTKYKSLTFENKPDLHLFTFQYRPVIETNILKIKRISSHYVFFKKISYEYDWKKHEELFNDYTKNFQEASQTLPWDSFQGNNEAYGKNYIYLHPERTYYCLINYPFCVHISEKEYQFLTEEYNKHLDSQDLNSLNNRLNKFGVAQIETIKE